MSQQIVMNNPHLNYLVMELEMPIWTLKGVCAGDLEARKSTFDPTDSAVTSALRRVMGYLKGTPPMPLIPNNERDAVPHITEVTVGDLAIA